MNTAGRLNSEVTTVAGSTGTTVAERQLHDGAGRNRELRACREIAQMRGGGIHDLRGFGEHRLAVGVDGDVERVDERVTAASAAWSTTSYCASAVVKAPVIVALPCERNCTTEPSVSVAVTPFRLTNRVGHAERGGLAPRRVCPRPA